MNKFLKNLNTFTSKELITIAYAENPKKAHGKDVIVGSGTFSYNITSVLDLKYFERGNDYSFNYTKADIKLIDVTDAKRQKVKVSDLEKQTIENFFSSKLIFDIKKNFKESGN